MQDKGARYLYNKAFWKTLGTVGLSTFAVSVLGVCFTVAFWSLARASFVGRPTPREATCAALIAGGPQDNAHLIVTKFRDDAQKTVGFTAVPGKDGAWALAYVPLVPDTDDQPRANDVRIVLKSHRARDARELEQLLASESLQGCLLAPALVLPQSNRGQQVLSEAALLRTIAPAIDPNRCWILDVSAEPVSLADDSLWFPLLIGTALFAIAAFNIGRGFDVPRSVRGLMIWIGVAALVSVWGWFFVLFYPRGAAVWNGLAPVAGLVFAQAGAGFVLGPTTRWSWAWLKRASQQQLSNTDRVQATETGFLIDDVRYPHELRDERVRGLAAHNDCHYVEQDLHSYTRRITIWFELADKIQEVATEHTLRLGEDDPLGGLFQRLLERLVAQGLASVKQGRVVDGDGWKLDKSGIAIESEVGKYLPLAEISRVEWRDDELCVWRNGDAEAILRVPAGARNAHLLDRLLEDLGDELAAGGRQTSVNEMEPGNLGRMLYERRKRLGQLAVELIASAVVVVLLSTQLAGNQIPPLGVAVFGFLAIACSWHFIAAAGTVIRCHEHGITWSFFGRERMLHYSEIESFTYKTANSYANGVYSGTTVKMRFNPDRALKKRAIRFEMHFQNGGHGMEDLRDHVSEIVADRMQHGLETNGRASWGSIALRQGGLVVNSASKKEWFIPFDEIEETNFDDTRMYVWVRDENRPIATVSMSEPNFYPGWVLYHRLRDVDRVTSDEEMEAMAV